MDSYELEALKKGFNIIAGVDEAGRGPLAGPVVAAAVIFPLDCPEKLREILSLGINDSKKLKVSERKMLGSFFTNLNFLI